MYTKIKLCILFLSVVSFGFTQDLEKDLEVIAKRMSKCSSVNIEVAVTVSDKKGGKTLYSAPASLQRMGEYSRSVLGEIEYSRLKNFDIRLDHEDKMVFVKSKDSTNSDLGREQMDFDVEALKKILGEKPNSATSTIKLLSDNGGIRKYSVTNIPGIAEVIMLLDLNKKIVRSVSYEYSSSDMGGQYVLLNYTKFEYDKNLEDKFLTSNYIDQRAEDIVLIGKYKDYTLYTE